MVEVIGDIVRPSEFVLNEETGTVPAIKGQMMVSGATLIWFDGTSVQTISGSNTGD